MTQPKAILFGSIGSMAETSDMQRRAYNGALKEAGLRWQWDEPTYRELLEMAGGKDRMAMLGKATGEALSDGQIDAIHSAKTKAASAEVRKSATLRPGVRAVIDHAKANGIKLGFVTTTYQPNIDAVLDAGGLSEDDFDVIVSRDDVSAGKPSPEAYELALKKLNVSADECVAIEDTANSVMSAKRLGIKTIATPGVFTSGQDFWQADLVVENLANDNEELRSEVSAHLG